jgi:hypothetical protein
VSSKILTIGLAIAAFAIPVVGPVIGTAIGVSALVVEGALALGLAVASNFLIGPAKPKGLSTNPNDRLTASLDPTTPRKIAFGNTALATDVRYQAFTGANQQYLEQIVCCASHTVNSIYELWLDNEKAWDSTAGVASKYSGFLTVDVRTVGTSANGIAIDSTWTSTCTLTGCAYLHLKYLLIHDNGQGGNDSPFASGVTSRMTIRGKGALIYDPRKDSTVAGGSGTQRATDQTTWAWDDNASRNPALQELWYELGWQINGKLAVGKGVPPARIDLASYAVAANHCDETITKSAANGGGTEPRYRSDGILSEGDDPGAVRDNLCATMNAVLRDASGKLSITVLVNDLATPKTPYGKTAFDEDDVIGQIDWDQTPNLSSTFNVVRGRRVDPSDNALYQMADVPEVSLTSVDGISRIDTFDLPLVQSNGQAQRLFKQRLQRNQYQGKLTFTGKPSFWGISLGDVFAFSHVAFGWTGQLFRCAGQKINRMGQVEIVAIQENAAIYAWDNSEAAAVAAATPVVYTQTNDPFQTGVNSAAKTSVVINPLNDVVIHADSTGTVKSGELPRDVGLTASIGTGNVTTLGTWAMTTTSGVTCTMGASTGVLNITALSATEVYVPVSFTYAGITRNATVHIVRQDDQSVSSGGASGDSPSQTSGFTSFSGTTFVVVSNTLTYTIPTGKTSATVTVNVNVHPGTGTDGSWNIEMKVQRLISGTWTDQGTTFTGTSSRTTDSDGFQTQVAASISGTRQSTSLTAGTQYSFRIVARIASGTPDTTRTQSVGGSVSVTAP